MIKERSAGILLHPTSLPGPYGIGDLGKEAFNFIDFMAAAGQTRWQVFPLGPTGYGDSPYQCFSAFAGNPNLISFDLLKEDGILSDSEIGGIPNYNQHEIDFGSVISFKQNVLKMAFANFTESGADESDEYKNFVKTNAYWLNDYSLFMAVKEAHGGVCWKDWDRAIALRENGAVEEWTEKLSEPIRYQKFLQFKFSVQWTNIKKYANDKNIQVICDLPIFIAYDSSDLWANKELFTVNEEGNLTHVAGVPPDYFSKTGQLWGNPLYRWNVMEKDGYAWWLSRFEKLFEVGDIIRIDHFRGFDAYWEIPGDAETAIEGRWVKGPRHKFFNAVKDKFGKLPIIAEDLGVITETVVELRDDFEFPGIKILQFAFGEGMDKKFLPHRHIENCVVHTGSHDNDTTRGYFDSEREKSSGIYEWTQNYLGYYGDNLTFELIKEAYKSVAATTVIPMQDMLNLGSEARMNFPGKLGGNWTWRFTWDQVDEKMAATYKDLCETYQRGTEIKESFDKIEVHEE